VFDTALDAATNVDRIDDFEDSDLIHLDNTVFIGVGATLDPEEFRLGPSVSGASGRIIYNGVTEAMWTVPAAQRKYASPRSIPGLLFQARIS
jgi:hypothetical protein